MLAALPASGSAPYLLDLGVPCDVALPDRPVVLLASVPTALIGFGLKGAVEGYIGDVISTKFKGRQGKGEEATVSLVGLGLGFGGRVS